MPGTRTFFAVLLQIALLGLHGHVASAQSADGQGPSFNGDSTVLRSPDGRRQIVAVRTAIPVLIDGALDDAVWQAATPTGGFEQAEPFDGQPATEQTDVSIAFDASSLYVAAYCHDSEPDRIVISEIRKDFNNETQDTFEIIFDTFGDRRNGFMFQTNAEGAKSDMQVANEGRETNASWDAVWYVKARRVADGWTVEMAIPFKSLRFERGEAGVWGVNFSRRIRRKNEITYWSPVPRAYNLGRVSEAGNLSGLPDLTPGRNLRLKPYALASAVRETGTPTFDKGAELGLDVKYGVTPSLTLDVTVNPDFAQVEADEQQVNLTQFSQFFPEKREFFLENSGIFYVGDAQRSNRRNPTPTPDEDMLVFFSRRIGLTPDGRAIPIVGGVRITGNVAGFTIGAMSMQTKRFNLQPANNYSVVRVRKNVLNGSDVGGYFMSRQATSTNGNYNRVWGADATIRFKGGVDWSSYGTGSATPGVSEGQYAWRSTVLWQGRSSQIRTGMMQIGEGFNSDFSYYRRVAMRKYLLETGYRPRPEFLRKRGIRETHFHLNWDYQTDLSGRPVAKRIHQGITIPFDNGGWTEPSFQTMFQRLTRPLKLSVKAPLVPPGEYGWTEYQWRFNTDPSRMFSFAFLPTWGGLWSGTQKTVNLTVTVRPSHRLSATVGLQRTAGDLEVPDGKFVKSVWTLRANYSFSTNMYLDSLVQYDTDIQQFNANIRFNLIHRPLSDLFVVYNEQQFTSLDGVEPGRGFIVKFTRMFSF